MSQTKRILFVCLGNICRSPMAEGIFRQLASEQNRDLEFDSAGTGGWHAGESPDQRMQKTALKHDVNISDLRARQFTPEDFDRFDVIYVMDTENRKNVLNLARNEADRSKVKLMLDETFPGESMSVPDPYFGGADGFENVFQMLHEAAEKALAKW